jgi:hypothetical protein
MNITARQGFELFAVYDTVTDHFIGVNLTEDECAKIRSERYGTSVDEEKKNLRIGSFMSISELGQKYIDDN